ALENGHGSLDAVVCKQIITESHGTPLALIELGRVSNVVDLAGGFAVPASEGVAGKIERAYAQRMDVLPTQTRLLVLLAAAEPLGDPVLLHRAAQIPRVQMAALSPPLHPGPLQLDLRA